MTKTSNNIKLGIFIIVGTTLLILCLYLIGAKKNLFSQTNKVHAVFKNVGGLMSGNNVRFAGINIGTVQKVEIINDTTVVVSMVIEKNSLKFIRKQSLTDIGSDGLMGNKLVNISTPTNIPLVEVHDGDTLYSMKPVATDEMMRTLSVTNDNILDITTDLKIISKKIKDNNTLWNLLADTLLSINIKQSAANIEKTTESANNFTGHLDKMLTDIKEGNGTVGKVMYNKEMADDMQNTIKNLKDASDTAKLALHHMHEFMKDLNITPGPLGVLARDTAMANDLKSTIYNLKLSTYNLNENMKALQGNVFFRGYFKDKKKQEDKAAKEEAKKK
jgi:phospholipid/cholesterol/gamma-HCH transport system substrate-binding protein